jgi:cytochrome c oxidase subunit 2
MNSTQIVIAVSFTTLVFVSLAFALRVIRSTSAEARRVPVDLERIRRHENHYAIGVVGALVVLMGLTAFAIPYDETSAEGAQDVEVTSFQFGWELQPSRVRADRPVEFHLRSRDVQHGFGIYDGAELIAQVQIPGRDPNSDATTGDEQTIVRTFDEPGTYEVLCLEFCGVQHHNMQATFEVVP